MLKDKLVVLTEEEYAALQARKPPVSAEVIAKVIAEDESLMNAFFDAMTLAVRDMMGEE